MYLCIATAIGLIVHYETALRLPLFKDHPSSAHNVKS